MKTKMSRNEMEERRLQAADAIKSGMAIGNVATEYGVSRTTAYRWAHAFQTGGKNKMRATIAKGRPPKLTQDQAAQIPLILIDGPGRFGLGRRWTGRRLAEAIFQEFGVQYHRDHATRILKKWLQGL